MNVRLLRRVAKHIADEPRRLDMSVLTDLRSKEDYGDDAPPCGTVGCIAGWTCVLTGSKPKPVYDQGDWFWIKGQKLLGLTAKQGRVLFSVPDIYKLEDEDGWPVRFSRRYCRATTPRGRASATLARIEHFIKTKGKE